MRTQPKRIRISVERDPYRGWVAWLYDSHHLVKQGMAGSNPIVAYWRGHKCRKRIWREYNRLTAEAKT